MNFLQKLAILPRKTSLDDILAQATDLEDPCPYACVHANTGRRVSALQATAQPPKAAPPRWALAARQSGLLEFEGGRLVLWGPHGPEYVPTNGWIVRAEGVLGLLCVAEQDFAREFTLETENAVAA